MGEPRRSKWEIILQLVEICKQPQKKTWIIYKANLNFKIGPPYIELAMKLKFLEIQKGKDQEDMYIITKKGERFANEWNKKLRPALTENPSITPTFSGTMLGKTD